MRPGSADEALFLASETDHLTICWAPDGTATFYPDTADAHRLSERFGRLLLQLAKHPDAIVCAAGACDGGRCGHG